MRHIANISIVTFCKNVILRILPTAFVIIIISYISTTKIELPWRIIITLLVSLIVGSITIWFTALTKEEKGRIKQILQKKR